MPVDWTQFSPVEEPQSEDTIDWSGFTPVEEPSAAPVPQELNRPQNPLPFQAEMETTRTPQTRANLPAKDVNMDEVFNTSMLGISPEDIPSGAHTTMPALTIPISAVGKGAASLLAGMSTPKFLGEATALSTPAAPLILGKWAYDMIHSAGKTAIEAKDELVQMLHEAINNKVIDANQLGVPHEGNLNDHLQSLAEKAVNGVAMGVGGLATGVHAIRSGAGTLRPLIEQAPLEPSISEAPQPQTVRPQLTTETKGEPNSLPVRIPEALSLEVPSAGSERVGERVPRAEEPALPQEQANAPVEAATQNAGALTEEDIPASAHDTAEGILETAIDDRSHGDDALAEAAVNMRKEMADKGYNFQGKLSDSEIKFLHTELEKRADVIRKAMDEESPVEATPATEGALKRGDIDPVMGARFDGEVMGRKMFTAMLPDGTPGTTFVVDAKATPEQMRAKYEAVRKNFDGDKNQPRPLPEPPAETPIESHGAAGGNMGMNAIFDPANYKPQIEFARNVFEKAKDFVSWSGEMIGKFGESIKQHLRDIWDHVRGVDSEPAEVSRMSPDEFNKFAPTGATNKGYELAKRIGVEGDRSRLPEYEQRVVEQLQESMNKLATAKPEEQAQIFKDAQILNAKKQYFNEANRMLTTADLVNKGMSMADAAKQTGVLLPELEKFFEGPKGLAKNVRSVEGGIKEGGSIINPGGELAKLAERLGGKVTGLAERIRARREAAGMTAPTVPGEGLSPEASVQKGRARIAAGENPESAMTEFEQTKRLNSNDIELVRAHTENLARATNQALDQFGRQSEQFKTAHKIESDWAKRTKAMQTEWARQGHAQQGEVDIDTGTFSGLSRYKEQVSKTPFTPEQEVTAKKKAKVAKDATDKADVTQQVLLDHIEKKATAGNAEKRAKDAADKTVRENAVRVADAENAHRTAQQTRDNTVAKIESDAEKRAGDAASKTVRENAIRVAKEENSARIKQMQRDVDVAAMAEKRAKDALDAANKRARDVAARAAREEQRRLADPLAAIWEKAKGYIEHGMDNFDDIRAKLATDLGLPIERVTRMLAQDKRAKFLTDEAWRAQERARMVKQQAKAWVRSLDIPGYIKAIKMVPKLAFTAKVMGHGPVALGTHAPMLAFQPPFWKMYLQNYAKMYRMVGKPTPKGQANAKAFYEAKVQDLLHDPLYTTAQRAGLINDPMHFEDYNSPEMMAWMGKFTAMGNRGYSVLKMIRQDMFNYHWNKLPKTMQTSGVAEAIADSVNHATGVVSTTPIQGSHLAFFAPRLEMSRAAWLAADPMKALATVPRWSKATDAQKWAAIQQAKEKAWVAGTMLGMLAINQGILNAVNSEQKINFDDPLKSDFLKFKVAGMKASYGNAMLSMARLVPRLIDAREGSAARLKNREYPDESVYKLAGEYARSQMAPAASIAADLFLKSDFQHRPLPNSDQDVPKRLRDQGVTPYTWPEYWLEKATPIPVEEGIKEVYKNGLGMTDEQMKRTRMAMASIAFMGATGGNLTEDYPAQLRDMIKPDSKASNQEIVDAFKKLVINEPTPEKKQKRINQILSENNPFTADGEPKAFMTTSKEKEEKFVEGLSPKKKEEYKQAIIERAKSYQRLQDALNSTAPAK